MIVWYWSVSTSMCVCFVVCCSVLYLGGTGFSQSLLNFFSLHSTSLFPLETHLFPTHNIYPQHPSLPYFFYYLTHILHDTLNSGWDRLIRRILFGQYWIEGWWWISVPCHVESKTRHQDLEIFDDGIACIPIRMWCRNAQSARTDGRNLVGDPKNVWFVITQSYRLRWLDRRWGWFRALFYHSRSCRFVSGGGVESVVIVANGPWNARLKFSKVPIVFDNCRICIVVVRHNRTTRSFPPPGPGWTHPDHCHQLYGIPVWGRRDTVFIPPDLNRMI